MDQVKIGKFIAERRKKSNLTQMQLAEKLNITDRAVSKWETGKSMSIDNILRRYIPIAVCAFIVILIGIISCTAINTLRQTKNYGTLLYAV